MDARTRGGGPDGGREQRGRRALEQLRVVTKLFDQAFTLPGTRWQFGLDALIGLVPGLGDVAGAIVAAYALHVARKLNAPPVVQLRLLTNIAFDALIGIVPILGDLFDFAFKGRPATSRCSTPGWPHRNAPRAGAVAACCSFPSPSSSCLPRSPRSACGCS